jgi:hypothetical protein
MSGLRNTTENLHQGSLPALKQSFEPYTLSHNLNSCQFANPFGIQRGLKPAHPKFNSHDSKEITKVKKWYFILQGTWPEV